MRVWESVSCENADHKLGVERSLVGISSVRDEAAGVDIGISAPLACLTFGTLRLYTVPPLHARVSTGRAMVSIWRSESSIQRDFSHAISRGLNRSLCTITSLCIIDATVSTVVNRRPTSSYDTLA